MDEFWHTVRPVLSTVLLAGVAGIGALAFLAGLVGRGVFERELKRNEQLSAPDDQQVRWHIQHIREDMILIGRTLLALLAVEVVRLVIDLSR